MKSGTVINRYVIEKVISDSGGTAVVYLAHLVSNEKFKLALKIARTDSDNKAHEDFLLEKEGELLQRWNWRHPGIVRVFPSPYNAGKPQYVMRAVSLPSAPYFLVMEYLKGESLGQKLKTIQPYPLEWKIELFYQILMTVAFIHEKGYAHRDLKPDNIVFREPISSTHLPQPVLVDFALTAKTDDHENYDVIENSLTIHYSPPERIAKSMGMAMKCDFQSEDVWSLGMIFHEILTGKFMVKGDAEKVKTTIIRERLEPNLPNTTDYHTLAAYIREMLNPDLEKRPPVELVLKALESKFLPPRIPSP
jgi:serine/threonine protein kinase